MNKIEAKQKIDERIKEYQEDLKTPLAWGCEAQISGIIDGLREAKRIISKITKIK
jgi:hypothetical protein